ncbi:single-stranded DNA-binding protein [Candidatus Saccharibacteria bacterium TM7i]|nr:single-stranded DNA-binding protein [Candidatus Saccharibacteria bacterium TM7i]
MNTEASLEFIKKYTADVLSFFGENVEAEVSLRDDVIEVSIPATSSNSLLIGRNADTLRSLQFILSTVLRNSNAAIQRVNLDIADYKKQRAERLAEKVREWVEEVRTTGIARTESLNAADRRIVHHVVSEFSDMKTTSRGEGRDRTITISVA